MIVKVDIKGSEYEANLKNGTDISLTLGDVRCFYAPDVVSEPYQDGSFVGSVKAGSPVNYFNITINPHGNGTHTECLGHISPEHEAVIDHLSGTHFIAYLISVAPEAVDGDFVIHQHSLEHIPKVDALIIRTLPNDEEKKTRDYSYTNPPYLSSEAMHHIVSQEINHLLIDLPSVDREVDEGKLNAHRIFWDLIGNQPSNRSHCTITELIFVPDFLADGYYLLNLQVAPIRLDASPSRPYLYPLQKS